ncbi:hypothetical protein OG689_11010 [Kitasatospora sp. NBC_00240]|uniref:hypothetical protein n=1 Tax=Kitasatospora sp. NBC_00240 TaxID=2903567 RepID=UPI00225160A8|nr:hypothetical protein [Kitasatospora sp. NBC_00240]MCX5209814.1 hypothetical protein [Kitasatospora sp. NBC_00240]
MATVVTGSGYAAVAQSSNPNVPAAQAVALTDGEGSLISLTGGGLPITTTGAAISLTYPTSARAADNAGDSVDTTKYSALAIDVSVTAFTGGTTPGVTFFLDRLGADGVWYPVWTSGSLTTTGKRSASVGDGMTGGTVTAGVGTGPGAFPAALTTQARFGWTLSGSPTSITFSASLVSRP